jgi:hypothetical protein
MFGARAIAAMPGIEFECGCGRTMIRSCPGRLDHGGAP